MTELPLNIEDLRRYSRQQRQEITSRLKKSGSESSDQAFMRTARDLRALIDDEAGLMWGPKVTAAKDMSLIPEAAEQRWREQLRIEALRRADSYAAAASEYQKKKSEAALLQQNATAEIGQDQNSLEQGISVISKGMSNHVMAELDRRNIVLSDEEARALVCGCILARGKIEFAIREEGLVVERPHFKHANHAPATLIEQNELINRWQRATRRKL